MQAAQLPGPMHSRPGECPQGASELLLGEELPGCSRVLPFRGCAADGKMAATGVHSVLGAGMLTVSDGSTNCALEGFVGREFPERRGR